MRTVSIAPADRAAGRRHRRRNGRRVRVAKAPHRVRVRADGAGVRICYKARMAETIDPAKLTFERAIEELESIVKRLEEGKVPLEESVAIYERGEALKRRCEELLRQAEARVEKITLDASGRPTGTAPLDVK